MNARAFLRWAGVNLLLGSWDNYFATPVELLPVQLRTARRRARRCRGALLHLHPLGLRQQLRHRLLRHPVAVHRHRRLAQQHRELRPEELRRREVPDPAGAEPAPSTATSSGTTWTTWSTCSTPTSTRPRSTARSARLAGSGTASPRPPTWSPTHPAGSRSPAGSSPTTRSTAAVASNRSCGAGTRRPRGSSTTCACATTGPEHSWPSSAGTIRPAPAGRNSRGSSSRCRHHEQDRSERPAEGALADGAAPARPGTGGEDRLAAVGRGGRAPRGQRRPRWRRLLLRDLRQRARHRPARHRAQARKPAATS